MQVWHVCKLLELLLFWERIGREHADKMKRTVQLPPSVAEHVLDNPG